jgi:hypothetical protein
MTIFMGCALYLNGSKTLCEKVEAKSAQSRESQAVCQGRWLRLGDLVGVGPRNRELKDACGRPPVSPHCPSRLGPLRRDRTS